MTQNNAPVEPPLEKIDYQNRFCFFVDILGFSSFIETGQLTPKTIHDVLNHIKGHVVLSKNPDSRLKNLVPDIQITQFSDSIITSALVDNPNAFDFLIHLTANLCITLLHHGVLLRGGVTQGQLFHTNDHVFGPALLRALNLEKAASYPRIIMDPILIPQIESFNTQKSQGIFANIDYIIRDRDGVYFVNYFDPNFLSSADLWVKKVKNRELLDRIRELIAENSTTENISHLTKYEWLKDRLETVAQTPSGYYEPK